MNTSTRYGPLAMMTVAALMAAPALAAPPPAVRLLLDSRAQAGVAIPEHARGGTAAVGWLNAPALDASRMMIELPDGRYLVAARLKETRGNRGERSWVGEFDGQPGSLLAVTSHRGRVAGFWHHGTEIWELTTGEDGRALMFQVDEAQLPDEHEPIQVDAGAGESADLQAGFEVSAATADDPAIQDLLVAYTQKAVARAGSVATLESRILNAAAAANAGYQNSGVAIRLNVVGMVLTNYTETGDMGVSLSRLRGTTDGHMDEIHAIRDRLGADLVALISEDGGYCGIAYVMASPGSGFASAAFSVTAQNCFSNQTLAHELGHNQGNAHDRKNAGSSAYPYSYGYRTCDNIAPANGQSFRTIMAYSCSGPRLNYFSNPEVHYYGAPMGVAYESDPDNAADNARSMNRTASITAAFRSTASGPPPAAPDSLAGSAPQHDQVRLAWQDNSSDESGFTVQRAVNGGAYSDRATLAANTIQFTDTGLVGGTTYSYRVRAWNGNGNSGYSNAVTLVTPAPPPPPEVPAPAGLELQGSTAVVSWKDVSNESGYEVLRESRNPNNGRWTGTTLSTGADISSLAEVLSPGTYRYAVRAIGAAGASGWTTASCAECGSDGSFSVADATGSTKTKGPGKGKGNGKK